MNRVIARTAAISCGGGLGTSVGITHPLYGVLTVMTWLVAAMLILVLAVCLPEKHSERLYRWGRLILGRKEPPGPPEPYKATNR